MKVRRPCRAAAEIDGSWSYSPQSLPIRDKAGHELWTHHPSRDVAANTRDLAKEQSRLSLVAFEAGTGTSFDLVTSQQLARQAELQFVVAEFNVVKAKIEAMLAAANCKF